LIRCLKCPKRKKAKTYDSKSSVSNKKGESLAAASGLSANSKYWKNWVVLHGDAKVMEAYILAAGESNGVSCKNSF